MTELIILGILLLGIGLLLMRNKNVLRYRLGLLLDIAGAVGIDVEAGRDWKWRYDEYNTVAYYRMVFKFWRSFDSFYIESPAREER